MKRWTFRIPAGSIAPRPEALLERQGVPPGRDVGATVLGLAEEAVGRFCDAAAPVGILEEISREGFASVCAGEGVLHEDAPVGSIARAADALALFAVTLGEAISREIAALFGNGEFALGAMLDAAASEGAEAVAAEAQERFAAQLPSVGPARRRSLLRFSPGYCGWHVRGQQGLFASLAPQDIGITLTPSCLMQPLKSVSGVVLSGDPAIFEHQDTFPFCGECSTHECRERLAALFRQPHTRR